MKRFIQTPIGRARSRSLLLQFVHVSPEQLCRIEEKIPCPRIQLPGFEGMIPSERRLSKEADGVRVASRWAIEIVEYLSVSHKLYEWLSMRNARIMIRQESIARGRNSIGRDDEISVRRRSSGRCNEREVSAERAKLKEFDFQSRTFMLSVPLVPHLILSATSGLNRFC
jgi:hypothetical protein